MKKNIAKHVKDHVRNMEKHLPENKDISAINAKPQQYGKEKTQNKDNFIKVS